MIPVVHLSQCLLFRFRHLLPVFVAGLLLVVFASAQRAKPKPTIYAIDASQSQISVLLKQNGLISKRYPTHRMVAKTFSGRIELPKDETRLKVEVEAEAGSMTNVDEAMSEFERKEFHHSLRAVVLEAEKFPRIIFVSTAVSDVKKSGVERSFTLAGDLTMHGVTKKVSFPVKVSMIAGELRASGEAAFKQSDFAMKPFEKGLGLIKVGDELRVTFSILAKEP